MKNFLHSWGPFLILFFKKKFIKLCGYSKFHFFQILEQWCTFIGRKLSIIGLTFCPFIGIFFIPFFKKKPIRIVEQSSIVIFTIVWTYLLFTKEKKNRAKSHQGVGMPIFVHRKVLFRIQNTLYFAKPSNWKIVFFWRRNLIHYISISVGGVLFL